jgi:hypothetical protein
MGAHAIAELDVSGQATSGRGHVELLAVVVVR